MPLYVYTCAACGKLYEVLAPMTDHLEDVPCTCGHMAQKVVTAASLRFKGKG